MKILLPSDKVFAAAKACIADIEADRKKNMDAIVAAEMKERRWKWRTRWPYLIKVFHTSEDEAVKFLSWPGSPYLEAKCEYWRQHNETEMMRDMAAALMAEPGTTRLMELTDEDFRWIRHFYKTEKS